MTSKYTKKELSNLRKKLPKAWSVILEKRTGKANSTIRKTLYGINNNDNIIAEAVKLSQEYINSILENKKIINNEQN
jgi:hypothetical protein